MHPFHLAIPVKSLEPCRTFYRDVLGCEEGRSDEHWVDFNFFGHQLVIHQNPTLKNKMNTSSVDDKAVPVPHFGVILNWDEWETLAKEMTRINTSFIIEPYIRFKGKTGEQATMFFLDPEGNAIEFKAFRNENQVFKK